MDPQYAFWQVIDANPVTVTPEIIQNRSSKPANCESGHTVLALRLCAKDLAGNVKLLNILHAFSKNEYEK